MSNDILVLNFQLHGIGQKITTRAVFEPGKIPTGQSLKEFVENLYLTNAGISNQVAAVDLKQHSVFNERAKVKFKGSDQGAVENLTVKSVDFQAKMSLIGYAALEFDRTVGK